MIKKFDRKSLFGLINFLFLSFRIMEVAKSLGLTLIKPARVKAKGATLDPAEDHKFATLVLPLVKYKAKLDRSFTKKRE